MPVPVEQIIEAWPVWLIIIAAFVWCWWDVEGRVRYVERWQKRHCDRS